MNVLGSTFVNECSGTNCGACYSPNGKDQWFLDGAGYSVEECKQACKASKHCNYASRSSSGQCQMSRICGTKKGNGWTTYKRGIMRTRNYLYDYWS